MEKGVIHVDAPEDSFCRGAARDEIGMEDFGKMPPGPAAEAREEFPVLVRIAVYESPREAPRIIDVTGGDVRTVIRQVAAQSEPFLRETGAGVSPLALREAIENLVHADFQGASVSILDRGRTVLVSDRGPGVSQKERAFLPGFSTASRALRRIIRGVGSGLGVSREVMEAEAGFIGLEDNLGGGTVVTLSTVRQRRDEILEREGVVPGAAAGEGRGARAEAAVGDSRRSVLAVGGPLSHRQQQILGLLAAIAQAGPTAIAREMGLSLATAHRELTRLEEMGLVLSIGRGKRSLTREGIDLAHSLFPA